jgi:hypothetical protein
MEVAVRAARRDEAREERSCHANTVGVWHGGECADLRGRLRFTKTFLVSP